MRCLYGGELSGMLDIFWALNLGSMGTTRALSLSGVMARLLWAVFLKKIISRKAARPQRDDDFLCAPATLREKNHFTKDAKPQRVKGYYFDTFASGIISGSR